MKNKTLLSAIDRLRNIMANKFTAFLTVVLLSTVPAFSANYYWVGGTGSWSMLSHWATTSGGTALHTQLPGQYDDVYFDANSFPAGGTVTFSGNCITNNLSFTGITGSPVLTGSGTLKIYGSLTLSSALNITYSGAIYFESTIPGCTVNTKGKLLQTNIYFNGIGGEWTLSDSLSLGTGKSVYLYNGSLITNNKNISCTRFVSDRTTIRDLSLGSSIIRLYDNTVNAMVLYLSNLNMNTGTSSIRFLGTTGPAGGGLYIYDQNLSLPATFNNIVFGYPLGASTLNCSGKSICTFNQVTFLGNGIINGSNYFTNLTFSPGNTYILQAKKKQTIYGTLNATGGCSGYISIQSSIAGSSDTIYKPSGAVTLNKCILLDICKAGAATFSANSSVDLGNNPGWTFTSPTATTYYWVGGDGNWESPAHWSLTSGGAGGSCIPGPNDNVIFNASSFNGSGQAVTVNGTLATCKNMTWTNVLNAPTFSGPALSTLKVFGSLNMNANFTFAFAGNIHFNAASTGNTIDCGGKVLKGDVSFLATGGWGLSDSLTLVSGKSIYFYSGTLKTNGEKVLCSRFVSDLTGIRNLSFGASEIVIGSPYSTTALALNMTNLTLDGGTSLLRFTGVSGTSSGGFTINGTNNAVTNLYDVVMSAPGTTASMYVQTVGGAQFHNVTLNGSANIYGKNTFNDLLFTAGSSYMFQAGKVQTINGNWSATGNCSNYIICQTTGFATPVSIVKTSGNVTLDHILLRDIQVSGGAIFTATNAMNLGGNSGWTFSTPPTATYYWINGSGIWSNQSHWSLSSGGSPATCLPGPNDNVIFDANSFPTAGATVTVDLIPAYCRNMTWSNPANNPVFAGTTASFIRIFGSLKLHAAMTNNYKGKLYFESADTTNTINAAGKIITSDIYLQGTGGWALADSLQTGPTNTVFLYNGRFSTNNYNLTAFRFTSDKTTVRRLTLGASIMKLSGVSGVPALYLNTTNMQVNAGTSRIILPNFSGNYGGIVYLLNGTVGSTVQLYDLEFMAVSGTASLSTNGQLAASFHKVTMSGDNKILGTNTYETLVFSPGHTYTLQSQKTQTITTYWALSGQCTTPVTIQSTISGSPAKVSKSSGIINGSNITMRDITAIGGATFNAFNSTDLGGNIGWNFTLQGTLGSPGNIIGQSSICSGQTFTYSVNPVPGAVSYQWTLPAGLTLVSGQGTNTITVSTGGISSATISVIASDGCNYSTASSKTVSGFTVGLAAIAPVCQNSSVILLTSGTPGGGSYFGAGVTGNQFNPAQVNVGTHSIGYAYNNGSCADTAYQQVNVMGAPVMPSQPLGQTFICQGSGNTSYTTTVTGGANANWVISPANAASITANGTSASVSWDPAFSGQALLSVTAGNSCGTSAAASLSITVGQAPATPSAVNGPLSVCQGSPASSFGTSSQGSTGFLWSMTPSQAGIINGTGSNISVLWDPAFSGNVTLSVAAYSNCDTSAAINYTVHIDTLVAQILFHSGSGNVCQGTDSTFYNATSYNATGYLWAVSPANAGTVYPSGQGAMINWDSAFSGIATVSVWAYNGCDTLGPVDMTVTVLAGPSQPVISVAGYVLTSTIENSYQWLLNGVPIQGVSTQYYVASATGYYQVVVFNKFGCSDTSEAVYIDYITGIAPSENRSFSAEVNPNPMAEGGQIILNLDNNEKVTIELVDVTGRLLLSLMNGADMPAGRNTIPVSQSQVEPYHGVCFFRITAGEHSKMLPVVLLK